jgi:5'/3'-nucleotidase SurE
MEINMRAIQRLTSLALVCAATLANPSYALDIALTNDDGWNAPGIQILRTALVAAGHNVTLAGPLSDQSGSSLSFDLGATLLVTKQAEGQYSVALSSSPTTSAKPATSALVAISIAQESGRSPDLLISGINTTANIGISALLSGTVGAAVTAVEKVLNGPIPAIAVGTDAPTCAPAPACQEAHYQVVADFVVRFVAHLQSKPGFLASEPSLLPDGVALVISYPTSDVIEGVKIAVQSDGILLNGHKVAGNLLCAATTTTVTPCSNLTVGASQKARLFVSVDETPEIKNSDLSYYVEGYVTIVPVMPDLTAGNPLVFKSMLSGFAP